MKSNEKPPVTRYDHPWLVMVIPGSRRRSALINRREKRIVEKEGLTEGEVRQALERTNFKDAL